MVNALFRCVRKLVDSFIFNGALAVSFFIYSAWLLMLHIDRGRLKGCSSIWFPHLDHWF